MSSEGPLEFDFGGRRPSTTTKINGAAQKKGVASPLDVDPTAVVFKGPERPQNFSQKETTSMNATIPSSIGSSVRPNIERQKREQKTINTILGGAATTIVLLILLVGALAGLGGYVLWKQIDKQSTTIAMLEANLRQELVQTRDDLQKADQQLSKEDQRIGGLVTEQRAMIDNLNQAIKSQNSQYNQLDQRLKDVERQKLSRH